MIIMMNEVNKSRMALPLRILGFLQGNEDDTSPYFAMNSQNRVHFCSKVGAITCKIRDKSTINTAREFAWNIRAFLDDDPAFMEVYHRTARALRDDDTKFLLRHVNCPGDVIDAWFADRMTGDQKKIIGKYFAAIGYLEKTQVMDVLQLVKSHTCKVIVYELEFFYLKCFLQGYKTYFVPRVCYHAPHPHDPTSHDIPIPFHELLEKVRWTG